VDIQIDPEKEAKFTIYIRIPGWARNQPVPGDLYRYTKERDEAVMLTVNGETVTFELDKGFVPIRRTWDKGDTIRLNLPMPVRRVLTLDKVEENKGKVALERGPIVYCAEWPDNGGHVRNLILDDSTSLSAEPRSDLLQGITVLRGRALGLHGGENGVPLEMREQDFVAIPYYAWAHRGKGEMMVWLAREQDYAQSVVGPTLASPSVVTASGDVNTNLLPAVNDQLDPKDSNDHSIPFFHWWPRKGTTEWIQYDFKKQTPVIGVAVYWFDDTGIGECRIPESWKVLYKADGEWKEVLLARGAYGVEKNKFNRCRFLGVTTSALRLEIRFSPEFSGGIHEWKVFGFAEQPAKRMD
jgi:hypothetical protein